ncbi:hypothetical protein JCM8097_002858 [Rhodosporidiobolus ruineniae]
MTTLLDLPQPALDLIVYFLSPKTDFSKVLGMRLKAPPLRLVSADVVAFSSTSKVARRLFAPEVFKSLAMYALEDSDVERVEWRAQNGGGVFEHARFVAVGDVREEAFDAANKCLQRLVNVQVFTLCTPTPLAPAFAESLRNLPHLEALHLPYGGVESLPRLLPLADKLTFLNLATNITPAVSQISNVLYPITVAAERRNKLPRDEKNVATVREQAEATIEHLAKLLFAMKDQVEVVSVYGQSLHSGPEDRGEPFARDWLRHLFERLKQLNGGEEYPVFPELVGIKELELTECEEEALPVPPLPLTKLEYLYLLPDDYCPISAFVLQITDQAPLRHLVLNGLAHSQIAEVFQHPFPHLRHLRIDCAGLASCLVQHIEVIVNACPDLQDFHLVGGFWNCEVTDIFDALVPLRYLRYFAFDHPWEKPREMLWPGPDGRTIRSNKYGHFTVISITTPGMSFNDEIKRRIHIDAVLPTYHKRFARIAKAHRSLRIVEWFATDEVTWTWTFVRDGDLDTGKLRLRHHPEIETGIGG